jgi:putative redox protein
MSGTRFGRHSIVAQGNGGLRVTGQVRGHEVETDQPERAGGTDTAPTPLELLSVSLAACIGLYVGKYCAAEGLGPEDLAVEVKPLWREGPGRIGRFDVLVHIPDGVPAAHHDAIEEVVRTCPVHHTLMHAPEITIGLVRAESALAGAAG